MSNFNNIINSGKPVLVDFYAEWCQPCKMMAPVLQDVARQVGDNARILKIDVDKNPKAVALYKAQGVPTLLIFKDGAIKWRQSGVLQSSQLVELLLKFS